MFNDLINGQASDFLLPVYVYLSRFLHIVSRLVSLLANHWFYGCYFVVFILPSEITIWYGGPCFLLTMHNSHKCKDYRFLEPLSSVSNLLWCKFWQCPYTFHLLYLSYWHSTFHLELNCLAFESFILLDKNLSPIILPIRFFIQFWPYVTLFVVTVLKRITLM